MEFEKMIIGFICTIIGYLCLSHFQISKKQVANQVMMSGLTMSITNLEKSISLLSGRIDLFLKSEIDTLKEIANNTKPNHNK